MSSNLDTVPTRPKRLIGPLTAAEWASFRLQRDDQGPLPSCCATVSEFRDAVFDLLARHDDTIDGNGKVMPAMVTEFRAAYWDMVDHGLPQGGEDLIGRLARYYLGDPPAPATDTDRMHGDQVYVELCNRSGQPTVKARPTRFSVCALPPEHRDYRYLVLDVVLRRVDPESGDRWSVRWGAYIYNAGTQEWEVEHVPDGVNIDHWRRVHEFPLTHAMRRADHLATSPEVNVNGLTAADIAKRDQGAATDAAGSRIDQLVEKRRAGLQKVVDDYVKAHSVTEREAAEKLAKDAGIEVDEMLHMLGRDGNR
jgi:hypothetical protein